MRTFHPGSRLGGLDSSPFRPCFCLSVVAWRPISDFGSNDNPASFPPCPPPSVRRAILDSSGLGSRRTFTSPLRPAVSGQQWSACSKSKLGGAGLVGSVELTARVHMETQTHNEKKFFDFTTTLFTEEDHQHHHHVTRKHISHQR